MIAVIHGGPGALGEVAPVARKLSERYSVLEPLQTATSVEGQILELQAVLAKHACAHAHSPMILIGHSWGAWLSYMFTARYPEKIKKLILIGSGPFTEEYVPLINETRSSRLTKAEKRQVNKWLAALNEPALPNRDELFSEFGRLMAKVDTYHPIVHHDETDNDLITAQADIFQKVLPEAITLRRNGELLKMGLTIRCPVVAFHGDYDPHPWAGVQKPLSQVLTDFRFILLNQCGHTPWNELYAKDRFYELLFDELQ